MPLVILSQIKKALLRIKQLYNRRIQLYRLEGLDAKTRETGVLLPNP